MKELLKSIGMLACRVLVLPAWVVYQLAALLMEPDRAFHGASQGMSLWPGVLGEFARREFYRMTLDSCSSDCCISFGTILSKRGARIGPRVYIGTHCTLGLVTIEEDVLVASNVDVISGAEQHRFEDLDVPVREQGGAFTRVILGADSWIGNRAVVMADVGRQCVIGAGSVVIRAIPERSIAVGTPAKVVGTRGPEKAETT